MIEQLCPKIRAWGADGEEHHLEVVRHPMGIITIRDHEISRVMARSAAVELCLQLVSCIGAERLPDGAEPMETSRIKEARAGAGDIINVRFSRSDVEND